MSAFMSALRHIADLNRSVPILAKSLAPPLSGAPAAQVDRRMQIVHIDMT